MPALEHLRPLTSCTDYKREPYVLFVTMYGILALPAAGLTTYTMDSYTALIALYTTFNLVGFIAGAWMDAFMPYIMHRAAPTESLSAKAQQDALDEVDHAEGPRLGAIREKEGLRINVAGNNSLNGGTLVILLITVGLTYASEAASLYAGLYMTTVAGPVRARCHIYYMEKPRSRRVVPAGPENSTTCDGRALTRSCVRDHF